jgi:hypothetical protein
MKSHAGKKPRGEGKGEGARRRERDCLLRHYEGAVPVTEAEHPKDKSNVTTRPLLQ